MINNDNLLPETSQASTAEERVHDITKERHALELRAEVINLVAGRKAERKGLSDRLEIGIESATDTAYGKEELHVGGGLTEEANIAETTGLMLSTTVYGKLNLNYYSDTLITSGGMLEQYTGGEVIAAGMSDNLLGGGGIRIRGADLRMNAASVVEEKVSTLAIDGLVAECCSTACEREEGNAIYSVGFASYKGTMEVLTGTTMRPMCRALFGVRTKNRGGGGSGGDSNEPSSEQPPTPAEETPPKPPPKPTKNLLPAVSSPNPGLYSIFEPEQIERVLGGANNAIDNGRTLDAAKQLEELQQTTEVKQTGGVYDYIDDLGNMSDARQVNLEGASNTGNLNTARSSDILDDINEAQRMDFIKDEFANNSPMSKTISEYKQAMDEFGDVKNLAGGDLADYNRTKKTLDVLEEISDNALNADDLEMYIRSRDTESYLNRNDIYNSDVLNAIKTTDANGIINKAWEKFPAIKPDNLTGGSYLSQSSTLSDAENIIPLTKPKIPQKPIINLDPPPKRLLKIDHLDKTETAAFKWQLQNRISNLEIDLFNAKDAIRYTPDDQLIKQNITDFANEVNGFKHVLSKVGEEGDAIEDILEVFSSHLYTDEGGAYKNIENVYNSTDAMDAFDENINRIRDYVGQAIDRVDESKAAYLREADGIVPLNTTNDINVATSLPTNLNTNIYDDFEISSLPANVDTHIYGVFDSLPATGKPPIASLYETINPSFIDPSLIDPTRIRPLDLSDIPLNESLGAKSVGGNNKTGIYSLLDNVKPTISRKPKKRLSQRPQLPLPPQFTGFSDNIKALKEKPQLRRRLSINLDQLQIQRQKSTYNTLSYDGLEFNRRFDLGKLKLDDNKAIQTSVNKTQAKWELPTSSRKNNAPDDGAYEILDPGATRPTSASEFHQRAGNFNDLTDGYEEVGTGARKTYEPADDIPTPPQTPPPSYESVGESLSPQTKSPVDDDYQFLDESLSPQTPVPVDKVYQSLDDLVVSPQTPVPVEKIYQSLDDLVVSPQTPVPVEKIYQSLDDLVVSPHRADYKDGFESFDPTRTAIENPANIPNKPVKKKGWRKFLNKLLKKRKVSPDVTPDDQKLWDDLDRINEFENQDLQRLPPEVSPEAQKIWDDLDKLDEFQNQDLQRLAPEVSPEAQQLWDDFYQIDELENQEVFKSLSAEINAPSGRSKWKDLVNNEIGDLYGSVNLRGKSRSLDPIPNADESAEILQSSSKTELALLIKGSEVPPYEIKLGVTQLGGPPANLQQLNTNKALFNPLDKVEVPPRRTHKFSNPQPSIVRSNSLDEDIWMTADEIDSILGNPNTVNPTFGNASTDLDKLIPSTGYPQRKPMVPPGKPKLTPQKPKPAPRIRPPEPLPKPTLNAEPVAPTSPPTLPPKPTLKAEPVAPSSVPPIRPPEPLPKPTLKAEPVAPTRPPTPPPKPTLKAEPVAPSSALPIRPPEPLPKPTLKAEPVAPKPVSRIRPPEPLPKPVSPISPPELPPKPVSEPVSLKQRPPATPPKTRTLDEIMESTSVKQLPLGEQKAIMDAEKSQRKFQFSAVNELKKSFKKQKKLSEIVDDEPIHQSLADLGLGQVDDEPIHQSLAELGLGGGQRSNN